jgi:Ser-tRNA(Ala) deacylase AlaX
VADRLPIAMYHEDSYLTTLPVRVLEVQTLPGQHALAWVDATICYPGGGGQPPDRGTLAGAEILRTVDTSAEGTTLELAAPVPVGAAEMHIDWDRRLDHMQQHTAQHLLSHLAEGRFSLRTKSFDMASGTIVLEETPARVQLVQLQAAATAAVRAGNAVTAVCAADGARTIRIDGVGVQPCGGTHVRSLADLEAVAVRAHRSGVAFVAGGRVLDRLARSEAVLDEATALLNCPPDEHATRISKLLRDGTAAKGELKAERAALRRHLVAFAAMGERSALDLTDFSPILARGVADELCRKTRRPPLVLSRDGDLGVIYIPAQLFPMLAATGPTGTRPAWKSSVQGRLAVVSGPVAELPAQANALARRWPAVGAAS